jgi:bis(5'-nucleosyl)-tetraphosphatase (symmetrical)
MARMPRRIFVGDVQGCREELERLLHVLRFDSERDRLEPVGDLVNRGPDSLGTLRLLKSVGAGGVLGNHDVHLLRVAAGRRARRPYDTFGDVLDAPDREELLGWLAARPFFRDLGDAWLVHAGLHPRWADPAAALAGHDPLVPNEASDFAMRVRHCTANGERPRRDDPPPPPPFAPWFEHWRGRRAPTVVFGHWAQRGLVKEPGFRGLDTGCVWGGRLTAWIAEEDRLVDVPAQRAYAAYD